MFTQLLCNALQDNLLRIMYLPSAFLMLFQLVLTSVLMDAVSLRTGLVARPLKGSGGRESCDSELIPAELDLVRGRLYVPLLGTLLGLGPLCPNPMAPFESCVCSSIWPTGRRNSPGKDSGTKVIDASRNINALTMTGTGWDSGGWRVDAREVSTQRDSMEP